MKSWSLHGTFLQPFHRENVIFSPRCDARVWGRDLSSPKALWNCERRSTAVWGPQQKDVETNEGKRKGSKRYDSEGLKVCLDSAASCCWCRVRSHWYEWSGFDQQRLDTVETHWKLTEWKLKKYHVQKECGSIVYTFCTELQRSMHPGSFSPDFLNRLMLLKTPSASWCTIHPMSISWYTVVLSSYESSI